MDYDRIHQHVETIGMDTSASECHGIYCGMLCGGMDEPDSTWIELLFEKHDALDLLVEACRRDMQSLAEQTLEAINGPGCGFSPLLPDEQRPLRQRARALAEWCQGFLYGLGLVRTDAPLSAQGREALRDLAEIARLDAEIAGANGEEDEEAIIELSEFVWVAAMLIFEERTPSEADAP